MLSTRYDRRRKTESNDNLLADILSTIDVGGEVAVNLFIDGRASVLNAALTASASSLGSLEAGFAAVERDFGGRLDICVAKGGEVAVNLFIDGRASVLNAALTASTSSLGSLEAGCAAVKREFGGRLDICVANAGAAAQGSVRRDKAYHKLPKGRAR